MLTFNQLTDSLAFLCAISDPATYPHMLELFRLGVLKVSRFAPPCPDGAFADSPKRVLRTASHYVQNAVERCLNDSNASFLFSALPFQSQDKKLLTVLSYSLQYSDPSVLDAYWKTFRFPGEDGFEGEHQAQKLRDYVKRYVEMILQLSKEPLAANPEKMEGKTSFSDILELILPFCANPPGDDGDEVTKLLPQVHALLITLRQTMFGANHSINNRSNWYDELIQMGPEPPVLLAEAVDLCYNYTMEASISGIDRRLDTASFWEDFLCRLRLYWKDGKQGIHQFQKGDLCTLTAHEAQKLPPWGAGLRLLKATAPKGGCGSRIGGGHGPSQGTAGVVFPHRMQPAETTLDSDNLFCPFPGDLLYPGSDGRLAVRAGSASSIKRPLPLSAQYRPVRAAGFPGVRYVWTA